MRRIFITILLLLCIKHSKAQNVKVFADTFIFLKKRIKKEIFIRSDSTFYYKRKAFESWLLVMGFWKKNGDTFLLTGLGNYTIKVKPIVNDKLYKNDSIITFLIKDCYGNIIPNFYLYFYSTISKYNIYDYEIFKTDSNGIIRIKRDQFYFLKTEIDIENEYNTFENYTDIIFRPILQNVTEINISIYFPKQEASNTFGSNFYLFESEKFIKKNNNMIDIRNGDKYFKK